MRHHKNFCWEDFVRGKNISQICAELDKHSKYVLGEIRPLQKRAFEILVKTSAKGTETYYRKFRNQSIHGVVYYDWVFRITKADAASYYNDRMAIFVTSFSVPVKTQKEAEKEYEELQKIDHRQVLELELS